MLQLKNLLENLSATVFRALAIPTMTTILLVHGDTMLSRNACWVALEIRETQRLRLR